MSSGDRQIIELNRKLLEFYSRVTIDKHIDIYWCLKQGVINALVNDELVQILAEKVFIENLIFCHLASS